jgi:hypothetical protein
MKFPDPKVNTSKDGVVLWKFAMVARPIKIINDKGVGHE